MTKDKDSLKQVLDHLQIPEPDEDARNRAVSAAMTEFRQKRPVTEKKPKGFSWFTRLIDKPLKGGPVVRKSFAVSFGIVFSIFVVAGIMLPNFVSYRKASKPVIMSPPAQMVYRDQAVPEAYVEELQSAAPTPKMKRPMKALEQSPVMSVQKEVRSAPAARPASGFFKMAEETARLPGPDQTYIGRDQFETITTNPVKLVSEEPVSTFSIDVDTTSYAFMRRSLNNGHLPQKDAVRIEELINYFDYDYPLPANRDEPFKPTVAVLPSPWHSKNRLLHIGIKGFDMVPDKKPRSNLVFLIDVSGSMNQPDKLPLLKNAFRLLVDSLSPDDLVSIVVYAGAAGTVLEPTPVKDKGKILDALERLRAGGSTAGGAGIRRAYALAEANFEEKGNNRIILATDGDFNVGIRNPEELKGFVERKRNSGVYLSVLGFGQGNYNDALMQKLAQNGNGNAAYIDNLNEARKVLVEEAQSTLFTIAKDVKIQIEFNPDVVSEYRLIGYETRILKREDFNNDQVDAGDVGAGHSVTAIYEFTPVGSSGRLIDDLRYGKKSNEPDTAKPFSNEYAYLKIRYKLPGADKSRLITTPVGRAHAFDAVESAPLETRFAAAVAAFGQLLRGDPYVKNFTYDDVTVLAQNARGEDRYGYRSEFMSLVRLAKSARAMGEK